MASFRIQCNCEHIFFDANDYLWIMQWFSAIIEHGILLVWLCACVCVCFATHIVRDFPGYPFHCSFSHYCHKSRSRVFVFVHVPSDLCRVPSEIHRPQFGLHSLEIDNLLDCDSFLAPLGTIVIVTNIPITHHEYSDTAVIECCKLYETVATYFERGRHRETQRRRIRKPIEMIGSGKVGVGSEE